MIWLKVYDLCLYSIKFNQFYKHYTARSLLLLNISSLQIHFEILITTRSSSISDSNYEGVHFVLCHCKRKALKCGPSSD